jgi:glycosyltransferase involved in cell wall biosynthesis
MQIVDNVADRPLIAIITNNAESLNNFRGDLIREIVARGYRVAAMAPDYESDTRNTVRALGADPVDIILERNGMKATKDLYTLWSLRNTLAQLRPHLVFCYFMKPVIYGSIAAWMTSISTRVTMVAGLGYVFTDNGREKSLKLRLLRVTVLFLYAISFRLSHKVILQNHDDRQYLIDRIALPKGKGDIIDGSGVNLDRFPFRDRPSGLPLTFVWTGRLLLEKGIFELIEAFRVIRAQASTARLVIVGGVDGNPGSLTEAQMRAWVEEGIIEWPGKVSDVRPYLSDADVFVLPSYREGVPRSTQEAMAMGLAVITTDVPGCRETVEDGRNGFLVPVRDASSLAAAMQRYIDDPTLARSHGAESRAIVEERFDVRVINAKMLELMGLKRRTM